VSLKRQLLVSFGVQGAGAAAVLLSTLLLGMRLGPEVQGAFSRLKAEVEFVAAFAMLGLPQALFFHVKSGGLGLRAALRWALGCAVLALPVGALYGALRHAQDGTAAIALLGLAVALMVAHGQLRALLLVRDRTTWFNLMTAWPQALVLAGVVVVVGVAGRDGASVRGWLALFALAFGTAAVVSWARLRRAADDATPGRIGWRELGHYGAAAWLTAALSTAAVLLVQRWVESAQGGAALGRFTMAMTLVQVPLTPISYAAPLLLRRWMEQPGARASRRAAAMVFALIAGAALAAAALATRWPDLGLGAAYAGATAALAVLLAGGAAEAASRVLTVQASAQGQPWVAVRAEAARWTVLLVGGLAITLPSLMTICVLWASAAWAAALVFAWQARAAS